MPGKTRTGWAVLLGLSVLVLTAGCAQQPGAAPQDLAAAALADRQWVDLSHPYNQQTLYWPSSPSAFKHGELDYGMTEGGYFYSAYTLGTPEHGGTHIDAPIHFSAGGQTVEALPLEKLIVPVFVIDVTAQAEADRDYLLQVQDIVDFEARYGTIPGGSGVLMRTRWDRYWPDARNYLGDDVPRRTTHLHFPGFSTAAAAFLVRERQVALIGIDTASIDHGPSQDFMAHRVVAAADVAALENLTGLQHLPPTGAWLFALPMKIEGGSGAPVRVVALLP